MESDYYGKVVSGVSAEGRIAKRGSGGHEEPVCLGIDAVGALHGGAERITLGSVIAAVENDRVEEVVVFVSPAPARRFHFPEVEKLTVVEVRRCGGNAERVAWLCAGVASACRERDVTHALFLNGVGLAQEGIRKVLFIQQAIPFVPEALHVFGPLRRFRYRFLLSMMRWAAASADLVAVQTETMKRLVGLELGCEAERISVIPAGVGDEQGMVTGQKTHRGRAEGRVRLLYIGNGLEHKNLRVIPVALDCLRGMGYAVEVVATLEPGEGLPVRDDIIALGYLSRSRIVQEMWLADCLVMPSLVEAVCLPLVEAMGLAVPVVVADRPYAREVCGEAAHYFDPLDGAALARAIVAMLRDSAATDARVAKGLLKAPTFGSPDGFRRLIGAALGAA